MKLMTIFGTRPEIIRLSIIIKQLDSFCQQLLVHTGQNYDERLSDIFFRELNLRQPDIYLDVRAEKFSEQVGQILQRVGRVIEERQPERILVLGDTNSALSAIVAARHGIPVYHLEAGNRCYDNRVPEEINRRIIDHCSTVLMPYTHRSMENLLREGIERQRIYVVGNPIYEVINNYMPQIKSNDVLSRLSLKSQEYFLVTMHRAENVDDSERLRCLLEGLCRIEDQYKKTIIISMHPRTESRIAHFGLKLERENIRFLKPLGFFDFVALEQKACCVITDSGTVQEECCIFSIPNVTIRDVTERPETVECGSNMLAGVDPESMAKAVEIAINSARDWTPLQEYMERHTSVAVTKIVLGYIKPLL